MEGFLTANTYLGGVGFNCSGVYKVIPTLRTKSLKNHLFCFGLGYCAQYLAAALQGQDWQFSATTRSSFSKILGVDMHLFDNMVYLPHNITHMLISIPPAEEGDIVLNNFKKHILHLKELKWIGYLSSTGVYGDCHGAWVDEQSKINGDNPFAKKRIVAEEQWLSLHQEFQLPVHIFRLSGIYGHGRNPIEKIISGQGQIIKKPGQIFSRIHVEDIVQILLQSMKVPTPNEVFNMADDHPVSAEEVMLYAYELLKIEPPKPVTLEQSDLSEMAKRFYMESRKVKNNKIKQMFGIKLRYPTYKEGLNAIFEKLKP